VIAQYRAHTPTGDAYGAPVDGWADPIPVEIMGWAPVTEKPADEAARNPLLREADVYLPKGAPGGHKAVWLLGGVEWTQEGQTEDFSTGPWWPAAGSRARVRRVEG
jgi:hypothetical protein